MSDFSSEVKWWEEWQLRILVLGSFFLQFVLFVGSWARHARSLKSCMWIAYLGSDALAIYALATLFNRHKQPAGSGAVQLELLWAPVLLRHLGGLHSFTAYSVEDNELWARQLVTMVSQVTVALYVFCRSWSGRDKRLQQAAILLFVGGVLKFIWKIWVLKAASFNSLLASSAVFPLRRAEGNLHWLYKSAITSKSIDDAVSLRKEEEHDDLSMEDFIKKARVVARQTEVDPDFKIKFSDGPVEKSLVDISAPYSRRLSDLTTFLKLNLKNLDMGLQHKVTWQFATIYADTKLMLSVPGFLLMLLLPFMSLASVVLFGQSHKDGYKEDDIKVTYILLWSTTVLEFFLFTWLGNFGSCTWFMTAAQHNIISFSARKRKPTKLMRVAGIMFLTDYINKHWYIQVESSPFLIDMESLHVCHEVINLVFGYLKDGWKKFIVDAASYKRFNNLRGQWTVRRHHVHDLLLWSLQLSFDHSVLIWHLATELCLHHPKTTTSSPTSRRRCSEVISNYMIYLLLMRPEMLMPGSRQGLFTITSDDIEIMIKDANEPPSMDKRSVAQRILHAAKSPEPYANQIGPWILKACKLAEDLTELLGDEEERWEVIQGVWVEMLCYSAGRCRGYLHAKSMGEGVEFLTYVWFLLSNMGMETFADKFQRPDPTQGEEVDGGAPPASQPQEVPPV